VDEDSYTEKLHRVDSFHALLSAGATTPLARGSIMEPTGRVPGTNPDFMRAPPMEHLSSLSGIVAPNVRGACVDVGKPIACDVWWSGGSPVTRPDDGHAQRGG
jgi:hypothetical protein